MCCLDNKIKLLIVEDNESDRYIVERILKSSESVEFEYISCDSLEKAVLQSQSSSFDIILADLNLPDSEGVETVKKLNNVYVDVPLIILSGDERSEIIAKSAHLGIASYILKSEISLGILVRNILLVFEKHRYKKLLETEQLCSIQAAKYSLLGEMSAGIAHEIATPLLVILGRSELTIKKYQNDEYLKNTFQKIEKMVNRINKIIETMRKFSRNTSKDDFELVNLHEIIDDSLELCHERTKATSTNIIIDEEISKIEFECKSVEISQVVLNLLNNACDAVSEVEDRWVRVDAEVLEDSVEIRVSDSGKGIPDVLRSKIMEPFFTTKKVGVGTGLGLSISKTIIANHRGKIEIKELNNHNTFVVTLPIRQSEKEK